MEIGLGLGQWSQFGNPGLGTAKYADVSVGLSTC